MTHDEYMALDHQPVGDWVLVITTPKLVQAMSSCTCGDSECQHVAVTYRSEMFHDHFGASLPR